MLNQTKNLETLPLDILLKKKLHMEVSHSAMIRKCETYQMVMNAFRSRSIPNWIYVVIAPLKKGAGGWITVDYAGDSWVIYIDPDFDSYQTMKHEILHAFMMSHPANVYSSVPLDDETVISKLATIGLYQLAKDVHDTISAIEQSDRVTAVYECLYEVDR